MTIRQPRPLYRVQGYVGIGYFLTFEDDGDETMEEKLEKWRGRGEEGDVQSLHYMGLRHERGYGLEMNLGHAFEAYVWASQGDNCIATLILGDMYRHCKGVKRYC